jgi:hypothetical protein
MFKHAYVEEIGGRRLNHEATLVVQELAKRSIPATLFSKQRIQRRQLPLSSECFVAGDMDVMQSAISQLGIKCPPIQCYPEALRSFLQRRVWKSDLGSIERAILEGEMRACFAKPERNAKKFTGKVFAGPDDFYGLARITRREPLLCSEPVKWKSEYRVYVIAGNIVATDLYNGDEKEKLDEAVVQSAVDTFQASGEAPAGYAADFGVIADGKTALVEVNDGFALGAYQISAELYTNLLFARWKEMLATV